MLTKYTTRMNPNAEIASDVNKSASINDGKV